MIDEARLGRLQKWTWIAAAASLAVFLMLITMSAIRLASLQRQVADADQELAQRTADLEAKNEEIFEKTAELAEIEDKVALLGELYATMAQENPDLARSATASVLDANPEAARVLPRVYIHIRREDQRERAAALGRALEEAGFVVPGIERLVDIGPNESELRYFRQLDAEMADAEFAAATLRAAGLPIDAKFVAGFEDSTQIRARHYELWLAPDFSP